MRINYICDAFHLKTPLQQNTQLRVNWQMKGTRGGETDDHEEFKISHFSRTDIVLTATFLFCSHATLRSRVTQSDSKPYSCVRVSQGQTERGDASPVNPARCQEDAIRDELLPRPGRVSEPSSSILRYQSPRKKKNVKKKWPNLAGLLLVNQHGDMLDLASISSHLFIAQFSGRKNT